MADTSKSKSFRRTDISSTEKAVSLVILISLAGIAYAIFEQGRAVDPSRFSPDTAALESTREAIAGKAGTLRNAADLRSFETAAPSASPASSRPRELPPMVEGLSPAGPTEHYLEDTLYEKINGRAPAYLEFNFEELTTRSFMIDAASGQFIDVYLYRMDSPLNAFGIFSMESDAGGTPLDFVPDGYQSGMGFFFRRGPVYGQVLASDPGQEVLQVAEDTARALVQSLPDSDNGMEARSLLPPGFTPGTITYLAQNAYGQAALKKVFEAKYEQDGMVLPYFAMTAGSDEEALAAWEALQDFYQRFGNLEDNWSIEQDTQSIQLFSGESFGQWSTLYRAGRNIAGVMNAPEKTAAREFVENLLIEETPDYE